jgi:hypothetical protein
MAKVVSNDFQYFYPVVVYIGRYTPPCHLHGLANSVPVLFYKKLSLVVSSLWE